MPDSGTQEAPASTETEEGLVAWLRARGASEIGDDCALVQLHGPVALTVDSQRAGVHLPPDIDPAIAARRLLAVNLSDLAAVGATPETALLALAAPPEFDRRRFLDALLKAAARHDVRLIGGDLSRASALSATLTLLGSLAPGRSWLRRSGAAPGDDLWLGGPVGSSAIGLKLLRAGARLQANRVELPAHLRLTETERRVARRAVRRHLAPKPQLELGGWLAEQPLVVAAIDVSDGLGKDLGRLCRASNVGALVEQLPIDRPSSCLCQRLGLDPIQLAIGGGEDYVLLFTTPPTQAPPSRFGCFKLGSITAGTDVYLCRDGQKQEISKAGFDHLSTGATD